MKHDVDLVGPGNVTVCKCGETFRGGHTLQALELILDHIDDTKGTD